MVHLLGMLFIMLMSVSSNKFIGFSFKIKEHFRVFKIESLEVYTANNE